MEYDQVGTSTPSQARVDSESAAEAGHPGQTESVVAHRPRRAHTHAVPMLEARHSEGRRSRSTGSSTSEYPLPRHTSDRQPGNIQAPLPSSRLEGVAYGYCRGNSAGSQFVRLTAEGKLTSGRSRSHPQAPRNRLQRSPPTVPKKKAPGDRWSVGASNCLKPNHFQRAGDRARTGDVQLGKLAFYQLNYARVPINYPPNPKRSTSCGAAPSAPTARRALSPYLTSRATASAPTLKNSESPRISYRSTFCSANLNACSC